MFLTLLLFFPLTHLKPPLIQIWCRKCHRPIANQSVAVEASKFSQEHGKDSGLFHPACFVCCICKELLVDLIYCKDSNLGRLFCVRHFDETFLPRCPACDQVSQFIGNYKHYFVFFENRKCVGRNIFICL